MINLLPIEEKKKITEKYFERVATVSLTMLGFVFISASILVLPAHVSSLISKKEITLGLKSQMETRAPVFDEEKTKEVADLKRKLDIFENGSKTKLLISKKVLNEVILKRMPGIKITEISYNNDLKGEEIKVGGRAESRNVLLSFRRAFEDDSMFKRVSLPISNFVKGSNIVFNLTLVPKSN